MCTSTDDCFCHEQVRQSASPNSLVRPAEHVLRRHRLEVELRKLQARLSPSSTSFSVSPRRPRRSVSSGMTSSGGMLPRFTSGPKCLTNHAWDAFVGASKMRSSSVDRRGRSRRSGRCASRRVGGRCPAVPPSRRLGDHLPGAGVELLLDPLRPTGTGAKTTSASFEPTSERTVKSRAKSAISSSLRSRGMSIVPSEISTCVKPVLGRASACTRRACRARRRPRRTCRRRRPASRTSGRARASSRGCCVTYAGAPAELDDVDVVAGGVEAGPRCRAGSRPLSMTCVRPPSRGLRARGRGRGSRQRRA